MQWLTIPKDASRRKCSCGTTIWFVGKTPVSVDEDATYPPTALKDGFGVNHFGTCPHAEQHHKGRETQQEQAAAALGFQQLSLLGEG